MIRLPHASPGSRPRRLSLLSGLVLLQALLAVSQAQVTLDGSLGPRGPLQGPHYRIDANRGQLRGSNLFHSFGEFTVPTGGSATFTGPNTIANILSRVTGGQLSSIDGVLRSEIAGANLFLLNPAGVMFGPNASLDVSGSFHVSTADFLRFADGAKFVDNLGQESVLTVAQPAAFGFLGSTPGAIAIQGSSLRVPEGKTLSVVGGDIEVVGNAVLTSQGIPTLGASGGRIQLASVASPGEVVFSPLELTPDLQVDSFARLGRLALSQDAEVTASGAGRRGSGGPGGTVLLRASHLRVDRAFIFADSYGDTNGAGVGIDLWITEDAVITNRSFIDAFSFGAGRAGDVRMTMGRVHLDNSFISSIPFGSGDGGNISVNVEHLMLTAGAKIDSSTPGAGRGGELTVAATDSITIAGRTQDGSLSGVFSRAGAEASGDAGRLSISTPRLTLTGGGQISTSTFGEGRGGELMVTATDTIAIAGTDGEGNPSGLFSNAYAGGQGGDVQVTAPHLQLRDGGAMAASSSRDGAAGTIHIQAGETFHSQNGAVTTEAARAGGGTIVLRAGRLVRLQDSEVTTSVRGGGGDAGNLTVEAPFIVAGGSQMAANAFRGSGGNVQIRSGVLLTDPASQVSASSPLGVQGTVAIQAPVTNLSGVATPLPERLVAETELLRDRCAARLREGRVSSLVERGRDGVPASPAGVLPPRLGLEERLVADPAMIGAPHHQTSAAKFALLAGHERGLPRLGCPP